MPRKIRELEADLKHAGFIHCGGSGSHRNYKHPSGVKMLISGHRGDDAKNYQEKELKQVLKKV